MKSRKCDLHGARRNGGAVSALILSAFTLSHASAVQWTTNHFDNGRDGANLNETVLNPSAGNVNNTTFFGKVFDRDVDGEVYAEPLVMDNVVLKNGAGTAHQAVYVCTTKNNVYCFDAEDPSQSAPLWSVNLGPAILASRVQCCCPDMSLWCGITGTPVIDPVSQTMYVVAATYNNANGAFAQALHALDITTGAEKFGGPKTISATHGAVSFSPNLNHQRASLLLQNGNVYIGWASHNDCGAYHGWIMAYNAKTLAQTAAYCDTATGTQGGIWMGGNGFVGDGTYVYITTGNGTFDLNVGGVNSGESFLKFNSKLVVQDYFTPHNQAALNNADLDLGAGGIMLIPGTHMLLGGGKGGYWYVVNTGGMGGYNATVDACVQSFLVTSPNQALNHLHGGPAFFNNGTTRQCYTWGESDYLKAYAWNGSRLPAIPTKQSTFTGPLNSMPGGTLTVSANGTANGVLWGDAVYSGNANQGSQPGILYAFDPSNVGNLLWSSRLAQYRDDFGLFAKNPGPVVANGHVYQATFGQHISAYGLWPTPAGAIYEAENATLSGGANPINNHNNYSGTGFVQGYNNQGATTTFHVTAPTNGTYAVRLHFANSTGAAQNVSVFVNGASVGKVTAPNLPSWDNWSDVTSMVTLNTGPNTIAYVHGADDNGDINLDYIEVANYYEAEKGVLSGGAGFANDHINYSGTGFVAGMDNLNAAVAFTVNAPAAGPYNVRLHYANSAGSNGQMTQTMSVLVNDSFVRQLNLPDFGTWDYWGDVTTVLNLEAGPNKVAYQHRSTDTGVANLDYIAVESAPLHFEAENLTVGAIGAGDKVVRISATQMMGGIGSELQAHAAGGSVTYEVNVPEARPYDIKIRVKKSNTGGIVQLATATSLAGTYTNQGNAVDLYSATAQYTTIDLGRITFSAASPTTAFRFTVTGKDSAARGYDSALDYLLLIPN